MGMVFSCNGRTCHSRRGQQAEGRESIVTTNWIPACAGMTVEVGLALRLNSMQKKAGISPAFLFLYITSFDQLGCLSCQLACSLLEVWSLEVKWCLLEQLLLFFARLVVQFLDIGLKPVRSFRVLMEALP